LAGGAPVFRRSDDALGYSRIVRASLVLVAVAACHGAPSIDASPQPTPSCTPIPAAESGSGTYYNADGTGNCSFDASPNDLMVAAMNAPDYNHAAWCGACLQVTGPSGQTIVVRVVDQCPGCAHGDLDLSPQAFGMLAPLATGRIAITWHEVACSVTGPIAFRFKEGTNPYWAAIQLRDARYPIATLEARAADGTYAAIPRADYNYFVAANGLGSGPIALRTTDARGHVLDDSNLALAAATVVDGATQFATCP
jgi:expansin (peptidoglycan-binding protein)